MIYPSSGSCVSRYEKHSGLHRLECERQFRKSKYKYVEDNDALNPWDPPCLGTPLGHEDGEE